MRNLSSEAKPLIPVRNGEISFEAKSKRLKEEAKARRREDEETRKTANPLIPVRAGEISSEKSKKLTDDERLGRLGPEATRWLKESLAASDKDIKPVRIAYDEYGQIHEVLANGVGETLADMEEFGDIYNEKIGKYLNWHPKRR